MIQDVVTEYSFSKSQNRVAHPTFDPDFHHAAVNGLKRGHVLKHFNWIIRLRNLIPPYIAVRLHRSAREALYIRTVRLHTCSVSLTVFLTKPRKCTTKSAK